MVEASSPRKSKITDPFLNDLEAVKQIPIVPNMLKVILELTGMGFAAVARVTEDRWMACSVRNEVGFGLKEGGELEVETTLCNEIRGHRQPIVIDNVAEDPRYSAHHTPKIYGLQSYISYPITLKDGTFFGTLCAIDSRPAQLRNNKVMGTFAMFAELLAFHLQSQDLLDRSQQIAQDLQQKNRALMRVNTDLDNFVYTASHDLKSPVANIESLLEVLAESVEKEDLDREEIKKVMELMRSNLKNFALTIKDLTTFVEADNLGLCETAQEINLMEVVETVKQELTELISETDAGIVVMGDESYLLNISKKNFKSILTNLLSNAIKYRSPDRAPQVLVKMEKADGKTRLSVSDNGLGIPADKHEELFTLFKRFHDHVEGSGLGLYIVKRMVDKCNGQIVVESKEKEGTKFTIVF